MKIRLKKSSIHIAPLYPPALGTQKVKKTIPGCTNIEQHQESYELKKHNTTKN